MLRKRSLKTTTEAKEPVFLLCKTHIRAAGKQQSPGAREDDAHEQLARTRGWKPSTANRDVVVRRPRWEARGTVSPAGLWENARLAMAQWYLGTGFSQMRLFDDGDNTNLL